MSAPKLSAEQRRQVAERYQDGENIPRLAESYGVAWSVAHTYASFYASTYPDAERRRWMYERVYWWVMKILQKVEEEESSDIQYR